MTTIDRIKTICKARKIPVAKLESDLSFGNGYISSLKSGSMRADRLALVSEYFDISMDYLLGLSDEYGLTFENWNQIGVQFANICHTNGKYESFFSSHLDIPEQRVAWFFRGGNPLTRVEILNMAASINIPLERIIGDEYASHLTPQKVSEENSVHIPDAVLKAAFLNGYTDGLTLEEREGLWKDAQDFAKYKAEQIRKEKKRGVD